MGFGRSRQAARSARRPHVRQTERAVTRREASSTGTQPMVVRPASIERFDDIEPVINKACWCQWWRQTAAEYSRSADGSPRSSSEAHRAALRDQCGVEPAPGVVAYVGDVPVGWCGFGPRSSMRRSSGAGPFRRSTTFPCGRSSASTSGPAIAGTVSRRRSSPRRSSTRVRRQPPAWRPIPRIRQEPDATRHSRTRASRACSRPPAFGASSRPRATPTGCPAG